MITSKVVLALVIGRRLTRLFTSLSFLVLLACSVARVGAAESVIEPGDAFFSSITGVAVSGVVFSGNTVFSDAQLGDVASINLSKPVRFEDVEDARLRISKYYEKSGFINSGAILGPNFFNNGRLTFTLIEGHLQSVEVLGNQRLREKYISRRIKMGAGAPLNLQSLQNTLLVLRESPLIRQINTELQPGLELGTAKAIVRLTEASPWRLAVAARNDRPPSVGGEIIEAQLGNLNLTGRGDMLLFNYGIASERPDGFVATSDDDWGFDYVLPINARDQTLSISYKRSAYAVIEAPFNVLDIVSKSDQVSIGIHHPLIKNLTRDFRVGLSLDRQSSRSWLFGEPFSLSAGASNGELTVTTLRLDHQFTDRGLKHSLAIQSTVKVGIDAFGSTIDAPESTGEYLSWNGRMHFAHKLFDSDMSIIFKSSLQLATVALPALAQFSIGGGSTVRGYRENEMVRDMGWVASAELSVPVWKSKDQTSNVSLSPFFDFGLGRNRHSTATDTSMISSIGVGISFQVRRYLYARIDWGYALEDLDYTNDDLQDHGIHFSLRLVAL